ncbi:cytochrome c [Sphingomonadaceae bacterium G21617-S1]|nr:cytochrome c [Sphingomonadaceae bacterium G21617-S1]
MIPIRTAGIAAAIAAAMLAPAAPAQADRLAREGHRLAVQRCGACHATEKTGKSPLAAAPPFRSLAYRYPVDTLDEALAEGITVGHPDMPSDPWEPADIKRFIAYLNSIGPKPAPGR